MKVGQELLIIASGTGGKSTFSNQITIDDVLNIIDARAQWCREEGESDMRNIIYTVSSIRQQIANGRTREEIIANFEDQE